MFYKYFFSVTEKIPDDELYYVNVKLNLLIHNVAQYKQDRFTKVGY